MPDKLLTTRELQDHLQLRTIFKVSNVHTLNRQANSLVGKAMMGLQYLLFKRGPMTMSPSQPARGAHWLELSLRSR